ncbi:glycosyltransferase [Flavivirga abyssicola]|uniref:glycosyltransferase n=1 Tax=Flavivirga abyssicola TaxID=3063533 RepID=UPI0026DFAAC4|nr:glycosyltransferase [Flavivirga sp. MEBiC07777]WVK12046.1 glycosyltransferase [Flavivirga sp. MEBiC07777]
MLSVLIPTYKYDILALVKELNTQCVECKIEFEILVYDDGSKSSLNKNNNLINFIDYCHFKELPNNIGRSAIRNLLALNAKYSLLLFVDAGTFPKYNDFIKRYISIKNEKVINGGMTCLEKPPKKPYKFRWLYTKKREHKAFCSSNFLIKKEVFKMNPFDESIKKYGYEDITFFNELLKKNISIHRFNNPVIHNADDDANTFIRKSENAIENLVSLVKEKKMNRSGLDLLKHYSLIEKLGLNSITCFLFKSFKHLLLKNFNSSHPSILLFYFYRLGYFCSLKNKK